MPISASSITAWGDSTDASQYTSGSMSAAAGELVLAYIVGRATSSTATSVALSGAGLTWVQAASLQYNTIAAPRYKCALFRAMSGSDTAASAVSIVFNQTQTGGIFSFVRFSGVDTGGVDGSSALVQSATARGDLNVNPEVTLSAFASTDNATYSAVSASPSGSAITQDTGFTEFHDVGSADPGRIEAARLIGVDTTITSALAGSGAWGAVGAEIRAAPAGGPAAALYTLALSGAGV